ncbi:CPBP family intramembrane metalloprotease [Aerococcus agrisoli]|uniref:CPBP family intramembrane metalloprotease n=1 Tax=Aerococcus agrisoli TaxID=2487350 RepID=A0A3N4H6E1_9LACT|nr:type II CAAX endopeptidase family protein [Aerococcus agrisoli]RPA60744.1 CPBP family intramembrane metalloprotease [Aerococcus agrisoli]
MGIRKNRAQSYNEEATFGFKSIFFGALIVILWTIAYMFIVAVPQLYTMYGNSLDHNLMLILGVVSLIFMFLVTIWFYRYYQKKHPDSFQPLTKKDLLHVAGLYVGILIFKTAMSYLMGWVYGTDTTVNDEMIFGMLGDHPNILLSLNLGLSVITLAPVMEEIIFRGMISKGMFLDKYFWPAIILSSLFFSSLHLSGNLISFLLYAGIGAICFMAYWKNKNLNAAILLHFLNNLPGAILLIFGLY